MASRQPERYIPHVMDVFRVPFATSGAGEDAAASSRYGEPYDGNNRLSRGKRQAVTSATSDGSRGGHLPSYSHQARTLTERDLKHIERHLSMKKTIRKQLSRHLSQAFVESNGAEPDIRLDERPISDALPVGLKTSSRPEASSAIPPVTNGWNSNFTVRQTGRAASTPDPNLLSLLKDGGSVRHDRHHHDNDDDSGHCSPTAELDLVLSQWGAGGHEAEHRRFKEPWTSSKDTFVDRQVPSAACATDLPKKSSFWKKLTIRAKSKR